MDDSEPVQVFIRIRPELDDGKVDKASPNKLITSGSWSGSTSKLLMGGGNPSTNTCIAAIDDKSLRLMPPEGVYGTRKNVSAVDDKIYSFDKIFKESASQEEIYEYVTEQVQATVRGYNTTIFAYGVTGSGKSYTMTGNKQNPGIIPRAIGDIFRHIDQSAAENDIFFFVRLSYVELYNNNFRNLLEHVPKEQQQLNRSTGNVNMSMSGFFTELDDMAAASFEAEYGTSFAYARTTAAGSMKDHGLSGKSEKIEVRESSSAGVFLSGPNLRFPVTSAVEAFQLIAKGNKHRAVASTNCNEMSSRSHAILTFHVESRVVNPAGADGVAKAEMRIGKIHLVDLAGSERLAISGAEGDTLVETKSINSSLTALGDVLSALSRNATIQIQQQKALKQGGKMDISMDRQPPALIPVPYRNSKLTHLLKDSLGGNSKTIMITNIRQASEYYQQTAISLMYAARAKKVRNRSTINRNVIGDSGIYAVNTEFERLKKSLEDRSREFERLKLLQMKDAKENSALKMRLQEMKVANDSEKKLLEQQVSKLIHSQAGYIASQKDKINQLQSALQDELTISQNRIAEQEQEIKWLKKALDETNNYASKDQIDKMQHVIDVWQNQAKTAHQELTVVLGQAEELKALNTTLINKIHELEATKKQLTDEINEQSAECAEVTNKLYEVMKEKEQAQDLHKSLHKAYEEAKGLLTDRMNSIQDQEAVLQENSDLIRSLEADLKASREKSLQEQALHKSLQSRIQELEKEKSDLGNKLTVVVEKIEKKSQQMIEDAQEKIRQKEQIIDDLEKQYLKAKDDYDKLKLSHDELKDNSMIKINQKDQLIEELQEALKKEALAMSKQSARLLAAEGEVEGLKDKIVRMQNRSKEKSDAFTKEMDEKNSEIFRLEVDLQATLAAKDNEKATLMAEFEKIISEKLSSHNMEIEELKKLHDQAMKSLDLSKNVAVEALETEIKEREQQYKERLIQAEAEMREIFNDEISKSVHEIESKHKSALEKLSQQHQNALEAQQVEFTADKEEALAALREQMQKMFESVLQQRLDDAHQQHRDEIKVLEDVHQLALQNQNEELIKVKEEYESKLSTLHQQQQEELANRLKSASEDVAQLIANHNKEIERLKTVAHESLEQSLAELARRLEKEKADALDNQETKLLSQLQESLRDQATALEQESEDQLRRALMKQKQELDKTLLNTLQEKEMEWEAEKAEIIKKLSANNKQYAAMNDEKLAELEREFEQRLARKDEQHAKKIEALQVEFKQIMEESIARESQLAALKERESVAVKLSEEFERIKASTLENALAAQRVDLIAQHDQQLQAARSFLLEESGKNMKELEKTFANLLSEKENLIVELNQQIKQMSSLHRDELNNALFEQQRDMMEKSRAELEKIRADIAERQSQHQMEITGLIATHATELSRQRSQLEEAHDLSMNALKEEVKSLREKLRQALDEQASKLSLESTLRSEQKAKYDELLQLKLQEKQKEFEEELSALESKSNSEVSKLKGQLERLKSSSEEEAKAREEDYRNDMNKLKASLKDRYQKDLDDLRNRHEEELEHVRLGYGRSKDDEISRLHDDYRNQLASKVSQLSDLEAKLNDATQSILDLATKHSKEKLDLLEQYKSQREIQEETYQREIALLSNQLNEMENTLKAANKQQLQSLQDQLKAEFAQEMEDVLNDNRRKDEARQREINDLKSQLEKVSKSHEQSVVDLQKENESLLSQISEWKERLSSTKQVHREEIDSLHKQFDDSLQLKIEELRTDHMKNVSTITEKYQQKIKGLEDELYEARNNHEENFETLKKQHEEIVKSQRRQSFELESLQAALSYEQEKNEKLSQDFIREKSELLSRYQREIKELEANKQREIDELIKSDDSKLQRNIIELREKHSQTIQELQYQFDLEKHSLESTIEELKHEHQKSIRDKESQYKLKINELQSLLSTEESQLKVLQDNYEEKLHSMEQEKNHSLTEAMEEIEQLRLQKEKEMKELRNSHVEDVEKLKEVMMKDINVLKDRLLHIAQEAEEKLAEVEERYQNSLSSKDQDHIQQIHELQAQHTKALQSMVKEKEELQSMLTSENQVKKQELQTLQQQLTNEQLLKTTLEQEIVMMEKEIEKYKEEIEAIRNHSIQDQESIIQDLKNHQLKTIEMLKKNEALHVQEITNNYELECKSYQQRIENFEMRYKESERKHLEKSLALDNSLATVSELQHEIDRLTDKLTKLQQHQQLQEHTSIHQDLVQQMIEEKVQEDRKVQQEEFQSQLSSILSQLSMAQKENMKYEKENHFLEEEMKALKAQLQETEMNHEQSKQDLQKEMKELQESFEHTLQDALEKQRKELQEDHQNSLRGQMDLIVQMIQAQSSGKSTESQLQEMQKKFMDLIQDLPDLWKQKHGVLLQDLNLNLARAASPAKSPPDTPRKPASKTPLKVLANATADMENDNKNRPYFEEAPNNGKSSKNMNNKGHQPWSSPSLRASPTDQLIAAILDGDVQGIRAIVRSKGEDLQSEFWHDLTRSVLPLHRAISGLHFHGSEKLLVATMEVLIQLGADINAVDHAGNNVLHKAIPVCTSKSITAVVRCLLNRGANPSMVNKEGDTPLHAECKRVRTASADVIEALIAAGANPNVKNQQNLLLTPLALVLLRGASTTTLGANMIAHAHQIGGDSMGWNSGWPQFNGNEGGEGDSYSPMDDGSRAKSKTNNDKERARSTGRKVWIKAAEMLIKSGARWDPHWRAPGNISQLHLLLVAFPPYREESGTYRALLKSALEDGLNPAAEDDRGRNSLFVLCEAMASVPSDQSPDSSRLVTLLVEQGNNMNPYFGIGGSDKTGRSILDIEETVSNSCLSNSRMILMQASNRSKDHMPPTNLSQMRSSNGASRMNSMVSRSSSYDWDAVDYYTNNHNVSRVPSGVVASSASGINGGGRYNNNTAAMLKSRSIDTLSSQHLPSHQPHHHVSSHQPLNGRSNNHKPSTAGGYFDDVDDEDDYRSDYQRGDGRSAPASASTAVPAYSPIAVMRRK